MTQNDFDELKEMADCTIGMQNAAFVALLPTIRELAKNNPQYVSDVKGVLEAKYTALLNQPRSESQMRWFEVSRSMIEEMLTGSP